LGETDDLGEQAEIYHLMAQVHIVFGRVRRARAAFVEVLRRVPAYQLPPHTSPKIVEAFADARKQVDQEIAAGLASMSASRGGNGKSSAAGGDGATEPAPSSRPDDPGSDGTSSQDGADAALGEDTAAIAQGGADEQDVVVAADATTVDPAAGALTPPGPELTVTEDSFAIHEQWWFWTVLGAVVV